MGDADSNGAALELVAMAASDERAEEANADEAPAAPVGGKVSGPENCGAAPL